MEVRLKSAVSEVALAVMDTAKKSEVRRLSMLGDNTSCKPGCNHCCSRAISITIAEAVIIREYLIKKKKWSLVEKKASELEKLSLSLDPRTWFTMNLKCPVLNSETGLCEAYEVRPAACSTHFAVSNASSCDPWSTEAVEYVPVDMVDMFEKFGEVVERNLGRSYFSSSLPLPAALKISEAVSNRSGLTVEEVITTIARNA